VKIKKGIEEGKIKDFHLNDEALWYKAGLCVPSVAELKRDVMKEAHNSAFTTHYHGLG